MRCYGHRDSQCCPYYNASTCVDTCPSPLISDDEYNCVCPSGFTGYNCSQSKQSLAVQLCREEVMQVSLCPNKCTWVWYMYGYMCQCSLHVNI